jgi:ACS family hexuronate transporter-like MFS transporter
MDRQTLAVASVRITKQFQLSNEQYGNLELGFGWAFAVGSLVFGLLVDRISVRWVYPIVLALWSIVGFATGFVKDYEGLLLCRVFLGFFEAGHWPCAVKTTQRLLAAKDRSMGNSVLQSGTSIGAIITPLVMRLLLTEEIGSWRVAFQLVGATGLLWIVFWFLLIRRGDLENDSSQPASGIARPGSFKVLGQLLLNRRLWVIFGIIACINTGWQTLRVWLPKFLQQGRGYAEADMLNFNALFFIATDIGCLGAGVLTLWLCRRGWTVHRSRVAVFLGCSLATASAVSVFWLPQGWVLLTVLLVVGAGALGVFPIYHALTQDISAEHQGTVTGIASVAAWAFSPLAQKLFGRHIDLTKSFDLGLALAGITPLLGFLLLYFFWDKREPQPSATTSTA